MMSSVLVHLKYKTHTNTNYDLKKMLHIIVVLN